MRFVRKHLPSIIPAIAAVTAMLACGAVSAAEGPGAPTEPTAPTSSLFVSSVDALTVGITPAYSVLGSEREHPITLPPWQEGVRAHLAALREVATR